MRLSPAFAVIASLLVSSFVACAPQRKLCDAETECARAASCVAGRCLPEAGAPLVASAQRIVAEPVDVVCLTPSAPNARLANEVDAPSARTDLCPMRVQDARIYMRFAVDLAPSAEVIEAYVLLTPIGTLDGSDGTVRLRALRVIQPWDARSTSWASRPTAVATASAFSLGQFGGVVRVDVMDIVRKWRLRGRDEHGVAIAVDDISRGGMAFALGPPREGDDSEALLRAGAVRGPVLELYVK